MIHAYTRTTDGTRRIIFLGVTDKDVDRLTDDHPIVVPLSRLPGAELDDVTVIIIHGETEQQVIRQLEETGIRCLPND